MTTWADHLISCLQRVWPTPAPLSLRRPALAELRRQHGPDTLAVCAIDADRVTIYLPAEADDCPDWRHALLHEYAHAALSGLVEREPSETLRAEFEAAAWQLARLLDGALWEYE